ncbi:MAG: hypothetical protein Q8M19_14150 [Reyranella sp.]|nr:hypothetical protein [Reyranella sp.]
MMASSFSEALRPLAARFPKVVREHEILRVAATVDGRNGAKDAEGVRREVLTWAQNRSGGRLPQEAWNSHNFDYLSGGRNSAGVRIVGDGFDMWAIRADDPDKLVPGRIWTTEVVVGIMGGMRPRFSARLLASTSEGEFDVEPHTPGFVQQVVERCGLSRGQYALSPQPWMIDSSDEAERLADMLVDPERALPVFVLTLPENALDLIYPFFDAAALARAMLGTAHIAILPATQTWVLTDRFGKLRSVFGGAARAYLPGFAEDANPYSHRLVLPEFIGTPQTAAQCIRWMRTLAASESVRRVRMGRDILAFSAIRNTSLETRQRELETEGASESEQLLAANALIEALQKQVDDETASQEYFAGEHRQAEDRAATAEAQFAGATFHIQQLLSQIRGRGENPDADVPLPGSWVEFTSWCDASLIGRLVLSPRARRGIRTAEFEDVALAARCLLWLANDGRERRIQGGDGSLADERVEEGIRNAHCGGDQFELDWQGRRHSVDWHIKSGGNTRNPKRCLRIYYFWDPSLQQIVVAEMPAHRRTWAT